MSFGTSAMEQYALKNVNNRFNTNIYSYLETSGSQNSNLYLNVHYSAPVLIRHLWQLMTDIFLHRCLKDHLHCQSKTVGDSDTLQSLLYLPWPPWAAQHR